jgi:hypothetical protein
MARRESITSGLTRLRLRGVKDWEGEHGSAVLPLCFADTFRTNIISAYSNSPSRDEAGEAERERPVDLVGRSHLEATIYPAKRIREPPTSMSGVGGCAKNRKPKTKALAGSK